MRPAITDVGDGAELRRWYWLKAELVELARLRGLSPSGSKLALVDRLAAHLDGSELPAPVRPAAATRPRGAQLAGSLTPETVLPEGQRCGQALRAFFLEQCGPGFRFDGPMRKFIAEGAGRTLGEAVEHWHSTRDRPQSEIAPQFELNRFLRRWHELNPDGSHADALEAWRRHRALPAEQRSA